MGYFAGHTNYEEWAWRNLPPADYPHCNFCGAVLEPTTPNKKYCTWEENAPCAYERWAESLTLIGWIHKVAGMTVKEFIKQEGIETYLSLKAEEKHKQANP